MTVAQATFTQVFRPVTAALFNIFRNKFFGSSLNLDFTNGTLDPRITFSRASTATRVNSAGLIESVATNTPRFDYDPVTKQPNGLLIEEQRTNLLTYSEQFDNAAWGKTNVTVTANTVIAPDGTLTADSYILTSGTSGRGLTQTVSLSNNTIYTLTFYLKRGTDGSGWYELTQSSGVVTRFWVNLNTGAAGTGTGTVTAVGNGWYRCSTTFTTGTNAASTILYLSARPANNNSGSETGNGWVGAYVWGAQLEAGSFATSYIPTTSAQVTRSADTARITGANFSSWFNQAEGTLYASAIAKNSTNVFVASLARDGSNYYAIRMATTQWFNTRRILGSAAGDITLGGSPSLLTQQIAFSYDGVFGAAVLNGGSVGTSQTATNLYPTALALGSNDGGPSGSTYHIKRIAYYPKRLSNTELQGLTS